MRAFLVLRTLGLATLGLATLGLATGAFAQDAVSVTVAGKPGVPPTPAGAIVRPDAVLTVAPNASLVTAYLRGKGDSLPPEAKDALAQLDRTRVLVEALVKAQDAAREALAADGKPTLTPAERTAVARYSAAALALLDAIPEGSPLYTRANAIAGGTDPATGKPINTSAQIRLIAALVGSEIDLNIRTLVEGAKGAAIPVNLLVRIGRNPSYQPNVPLGSAINISQADQALLNNLTTSFLTNPGSPQAIGDVLLAVLGASQVAAQYQLTATAAQNLVSKIEALDAAPEMAAADIKQAAANLREFATQAAASLAQVPAGEGAGTVLAGKAEFLNGAVATLQQQRSALVTQLQQAEAALGASFMAVQQAVQALETQIDALIASINDAVGGARSLFGSVQKFVTVKDSVVALNAVSLSPQVVDLAQQGVQEGDRITLRVAAGTDAQTASDIGSPVVLSAFQPGVFRRDMPIVLYAFPTRSGSKFDDSPGLGYSLMFHPGSSNPDDMYRPPLGFGLNLAVLNFDKDGAYEFGAAGTVGLLDDLIQFGFGYNFTQSSPYAFVGLRIRTR